MKKLVVARHGHYSGEHLNAHGEAQMRNLAKQLRPYINGGSIFVLSSTAPRASESADVLSEALGGVPVEKHPILWSDNDHWMDLAKAFGLVSNSEDRADLVLVVTHLEYAEDFPKHFSAQKQWTSPLQCCRIEKGEAVILDCEQQTATFIR